MLFVKDPRLELLANYIIKLKPDGLFRQELTEDEIKEKEKVANVIYVANDKFINLVNSHNDHMEKIVALAEEMEVSYLRTNIGMLEKMSSNMLEYDDLIVESNGCQFIIEHVDDYKNLKAEIIFNKIKDPIIFLKSISAHTPPLPNRYEVCYDGKCDLLFGK